MRDIQLLSEALASASSPADVAAIASTILEFSSQRGEALAFERRRILFALHEKCIRSRTASEVVELQLLEAEARVQQLLGEAKNSARTWIEWLAAGGSSTSKDAWELCVRSIISAGLFGDVRQYLGAGTSGPSPWVEQLLQESGAHDIAAEQLESGLVMQAGTNQQIDAIAAVMRDARTASQALDTAQAVSRVLMWVDGQSVSISEGLAPSAGIPSGLTVLFVSGFVYSGSGAVVDFLSGHSKVGTELSTQELAVFEGSYGPLSVIDAPAESQRRAIGNFLLWSVLGVPPHPRSKPAFRRTSLWQIADESCRDCLPKLVNELLDELATLREPEERLATVFLAKCYERIITSFVQRSSGVLLVSNGIRPYQARLLDLVPGAHMIAVVRDACDQYVSQSIERPSPDEPEAFLTKLGRRYRAFNRLRDDPQYRDRIDTVHFEDFVLKGRIRDDVLRFIGEPTSERQHLEDQMALSLSVSAGNIGLGTRFGDPRVMRDIQHRITPHAPPIRI